MRWRVAGETEPTCSWEYDEGRDRLLSIYEKGKTKQWNAATLILCFFFFSSRRGHTRCLSYWSSDVCSSDLGTVPWTPVPPLVTVPAIFLHYQFQALPGQKFYEYAGTVTNGGTGVQGTVPRVRFYSTLDWKDRQSVA